MFIEIISLQYNGSIVKSNHPFSKPKSIGNAQWNSNSLPTSLNNLYNRSGKPSIRFPILSHKSNRINSNFSLPANSALSCTAAGDCQLLAVTEPKQAVYYRYLRLWTLTYIGSIHQPVSRNGRLVFKYLGENASLIYLGLLSQIEWAYKVPCAKCSLVRFYGAFYPPTHE